MECSQPVKYSPFLALPREIRDQILGELFFPDQQEPVRIWQYNYLGLAPTAVRQIFPYQENHRNNGWPYTPTEDEYNEERRVHFEVAIIRTCRQLQHEAEAIFYGTSSWNLMYRDWDPRTKESYEFFQALPKRLRRLIKRVERKCYSVNYYATISLFDWQVFMTFLARECPNLQSLKLWGPGDVAEGPDWVRSCQRDAEWVQAILQIKSLTYFDIPVITGGVIYDFPEFTDDFLPWLKRSLTEKAKTPATREHQPARPAPFQPAGQFPFLELDRTLRDRIYREVLLPANKELHPYIKPWFDQTTLNVIPLFLTCKQIESEAKSVLYLDAKFPCPVRKYHEDLRRFLEKASVNREIEPLPMTRVSKVFRKVKSGPGKLVSTGTSIMRGLRSRNFGAEDRGGWER